MNVEDAKGRLSLITHNALLQVETLGRQVREELVLPYCRKPRFEYTSGNGMWFFTTMRRKEPTHMAQAFEFEAIGVDPPTELLELLSSSIFNHEGTTLGDYVDNVRWPKRSK